jgi:uncharacterized protein
MLPQMETEVRDDPAKERFEVYAYGALAGFSQYSLQGSRITIFHTEVEPGFEGHGVGSALARGALDEVRERGLELIPTCPFIAGYIRGHSGEYLDLVVPALRDGVISGR